MSIVITEPFNNLTSWTNVGTAVISSAQSFSSGNSLLIDATGSAKYVSRIPAGGTRVLVFRCYYRIETDANASASIFQVTTSGGSMTLQARTGRKIRTFISAGGTESSVMNLNQWYLLDVMFRSDSGTHSVAYKIDGVDQPGATVSRTAADFTLIQIGNTATNTYKIYFDEYKEANTTGEYPLGGDATNAAAGHSSGTGAASAITTSEKPSAGAATGTGAANVIAASEKPAGGVATGTGAAGAITPSQTTMGGAATGVGAAADAVGAQGISAAAGHAAGTGAAANATTVPGTRAIADVAAGAGAAATPGGTASVSMDDTTGTGTAFAAVTATDDSVSPSPSVGTGAALGAVVTVGPSAGAATGTGQAAFAVEAVLQIGSGQAAGAGAASAPFASVPSFISAPVAAGTGAAGVPSILVVQRVAAALSAETLVDAVTDTFTRSVSSGLGTSDSGDAWTATGAAAAYNVDGSAATFLHSGSNQARRAWTAGVSLANVEATFRWKSSAIAVGALQQIRVHLRQTVADGDYLYPQVIAATDQSMTLTLNRRLLGVETELASFALPQAHVADTYYTFKFRLLGQGLVAKHWRSDTTEPADWQVAATDTQITAPGGVGMGTYVPPGATLPLTFSWDLADFDQITGSQAYDAAPVPQVVQEASAGLGAGTGTAADTSAAVSFSSEHAAGTGAAEDIGGTVEAPIEHASGTGAAADAATSGAQPIDVATGAGAASDLTVDIKGRADVAEPFGTAFDPTVSVVPQIYVDADQAFGFGAATDSLPAVSPSATAVAGTGAAADLSSSVAPNQTLAEGSGLATPALPATDDDVAVTPFTALGAGIARDVTGGTVSAGIEHASGTGAVLAAPVSLDLAPAASAGIGAAYVAALSSVIFPEIAEAIGSTEAVYLDIAPYPNEATGDGQAIDTGTGLDKLVAAFLASGTGQAPDADAQPAHILAAALASGTGTAADPFALSDKPVHPDTAAGTGAVASIHADTATSVGVAPAVGVAYHPDPSHSQATPYGRARSGGWPTVQ